jgi:hypothetical protein
MAIVGIATDLPTSPTTDASLNQRKYTRRWLVQTNDYADGPAIVTHATGLPRLYFPYVFGNEFDFYAVLRSLKADRLNPNSLYWVVTGEYSTPEPYKRHRPSGGKQDTTGANDNPLLQLPEIETEWEKFHEVVYYVYDTNIQMLVTCQNSAGEVFNPPPTRDSSRLILTISRNEDLASNHPGADVIYQDTVNADVFWGLPPGTWKLQAIKARREQKTLATVGTIFAYLKVTYKFEARVTWDTLILDSGTYYWTSAPGSPGRRKVRFLTSDGHPTKGALNGTGQALYSQPPMDDETIKPPVFRPFRFYKRLPFGPLNLPQSFADTA